MMRRAGGGWARWFSSVAGRFPTSDSEAEIYIKKKFIDGMMLNKARYTDYSKTRMLRLNFYRDFSLMRRQGVAGIGAYKSGLEFFAKLGMPSRAQLMLDMALEDHIPPNMSMYMKVLQGYAAVGQVRGVSYILRRTWQMSVQTEIAGKFIRYAIMALQRSGDRLAMFRIAVNTWPIHKGHPSIYTRLLSACVSYEQGGLLFTEMVDKDIGISIADWGALVDSCCLNGDMKSAVSVMETMVNDFNTPPTMIHLSLFLQSLVYCGDPKGFARLLQIMEDKDIADPIVGTLTYRYYEVSREPPPTALPRVGSLRIVEILIGIHAVRGDYQAALDAFENRGIVIGSTKVWHSIVVRLLSAALHRRVVELGHSGWELVKMSAQPVPMETRGPCEAVIYAMIDSCYMNKGFGCVRVWRLMKPFIVKPNAKRLKISPMPVYHLAHCVALRLTLACRQPVPSPHRISSLLTTIEDIHATLYDKSPWTASRLLSPLLQCYGTLSLVDKAVDLYKLHLLAGHPAHLLEHANVFRKIFELRDDTAGLSHINNLAVTMQQAEAIVMTHAR
eukprot:TRINITY_DN6624_c0_g1_i2.p1 TRINITY_DN6624_c0_g1~~TRINITY_DN6624_c0_g1_i2.p1  ORF type:complete len:558 (+),score=82.19 TRINITY_DN6624_c0_g1_i2:111-1784(+)